MRYGIGATNLSVSSLRREMILIRKFLSEIGQDGQTDAAEITEGQMDDYFRELAEKESQPETFNVHAIGIQHFFDFLIARGYIERAPFCVDYYLKKIVPKHNDRSVEEKVWAEILQKLPRLSGGHALLWEA